MKSFYKKDSFQNKREIALRTNLKKRKKFKKKLKGKNAGAIRHVD